MLSKPGAAKWAATLSIATILVAGCTHAVEEGSIAPLVPAAGRVDPGLGPGTRALSSGPGYKGSPSWSPKGDRIAFTVDGYVVDRPIDSEDPRHWTTRDFIAKDTEWISEDTLMILGAAAPSGADDSPTSLYKARAVEDSLQLKRVEKEVSAIGPGRRGLIFALSRGTSESGLALTRGSGKVHRLYSEPIAGRVTALSLSPDGDRAALAVRLPGDPETSGLHVFDLRKGKGQEITRLDGNLEILGAPQWIGRYIYFVAGEIDAPSDPAPGVGEDFVAASIRVSPGGERLAVIGRLNPTSPTNLYVLDPLAEDLSAVTTNEDMEIKIGPDDLAWSPGGESVAVIARGTLSTEPEVRAAPAARLLADFYNLYEISVGGPEEAPP